MEGNREIGVVIDGRITMGYLCPTTRAHLLLPLSFVLVKANLRV